MFKINLTVVMLLPFLLSFLVWASRLATATRSRDLAQDISEIIELSFSAESDELGQVKVSKWVKVARSG